MFKTSNLPSILIRDNAVGTIAQGLGDGVGQGVDGLLLGTTLADDD